MKKKLLTIALAITLVACNIVGGTSAYAKTVDVNQGTDVSISTKENVTKQEAKVVLGIFVKSQIKSDKECPWTKETKVKKCQVLYDKNDNVSGYTFELKTDGNDTGYVTVGTNLGYNFIHEFSYTDIPLYQNIENEYDKVYYTAPSTYYVQDNGKIKGFSNENEEIVTTDAAVKIKNYATTKKTVSRIKVFDKDELKIGFKSNNQETKKKNVKFINKIDNAIEKVKTNINTSNVSFGAANGQYEDNSYVIDDLYDYLDDVYGNDYELEESKSLSVPAYKQKDFESGANNCTLSALTMLASYWRDELGYDNIPSSKDDVYDTIHDIATGYGYSAEDGTMPYDMDNIAEDSFSKWGYNVNSSNAYFPTWIDIEDEILDKHPCLLSITWGTYENHTILVRGYKNYDVDKFLRVNDNWVSYSRYISWDLFGSPSSMTSVDD